MTAQVQESKNVLDRKDMHKESMDHYIGIHNEVIDNRKANDEEDSEAMKEIKGKLHTDNEMLLKMMSPDPEEYKEQILELRLGYADLIGKCNDYIDEHPALIWTEAWNRKKLVKRLKRTLKEEMAHFRDLSEDSELFKDRVDGKLMGYALGNTVRDYQAINRSVQQKKSGA